jgi:hypothetical protein
MKLLDLDAATYVRHPLHGGERTWTETNCYVDLWIEVLHALGCDPLAGAAFTLSSDFEGDQFSFFKYPLEDLRALYGLEVGEMNVWRPLEDHIAEQLELGRLLTIEVDSWFLPDTAGVSYQIDHVKSSIVPNLIDVASRRLGYFHNAGYFEVSGDDMEALLRRTEPRDPASLVPYVELVRLERLQVLDDTDLLPIVVSLTAQHLARRPTTNPVTRFRKRLDADIAWLRDQDLALFHQWAFGTCRQCGANAELAADFVAWLHERDGGGLEPVVADLRALSEAAKSLQFSLARAVRGRAVDPAPTLDEMERRWDSAMAALAIRYG